jgi:hypothetical protein
MCLQNNHLDGMLSLVVSYIPQLKSVTASETRALPDLFRNFRSHAPLLEKLEIDVAATRDLILDSALFDGDLSSLHNLPLFGVVTHSPWNETANVEVFTSDSRSKTP